MALEIRELLIRAVVAPAADEKAAPPAQSGPTRAQIVAECVEQVLDILRLKQER